MGGGFVVVSERHEVRIINLWLFLEQHGQCVVNVWTFLKKYDAYLAKISHRDAKSFQAKAHS